MELTIDDPRAPKFSCLKWKVYEHAELQNYFDSTYELITHLNEETRNLIENNEKNSNEETLFDIENTFIDFRPMILA